MQSVLVNCNVWTQIPWWSQGAGDGVLPAWLLAGWMNGEHRGVATDQDHKTQSLKSTGTFVLVILNFWNIVFKPTTFYLKNLNLQKVTQVYSDHPYIPLIQLHQFFNTFLHTCFLPPFSLVLLTSSYILTFFLSKKIILPVLLENYLRLL